MEEISQLFVRKMFKKAFENDYNEYFFSFTPYNIIAKNIGFYEKNIIENFIELMEITAEYKIFDGDYLVEFKSELYGDHDMVFMHLFKKNDLEELIKESI